MVKWYHGVMTKAQQRLIEALKAEGGEAEYWPLMNDWVKDRGPAESLAFRNICRTFDALHRQGIVTLDNDGIVHLVNQ